jgi:hypothetical protein
LLVGGGASASWLIVQSGAGVAAMALILPHVRVGMSQLASALVILVPLALLSTLWLDKGIDGVHRWLSLGPIRLHIGLLLVPGLLTIHAREASRYSALSLMVCGMIIGSQPDLGMTVGLSIALAAIVLARRRQGDLLPFVGLLVAFAGALAAVDPLQPVPLVENVLTDSWQWTPWTGPLTLLGTLLLPAALLWRARMDSSSMVSAFALTGLWVGLLMASVIGAYPVPLLGYGASAVLGWGLALALQLADGTGTGR